MRRRYGRGLVAVVGAALLAVGAASCSSSSSSSQATSAAAPAVKPTKIIPGPAGPVAMSEISANDVAWILAGTSGARNIRTVDLQTGQLGSPVPVSSNADAISQAPSGLVAIGIATPTTGAVEIVSASAASQPIVTIPVSGPVVYIAAGSDGQTFYVLERIGQASSVQLVNASLGRIVSPAIPVEANAQAIAPTPDGSSIYVVDGAGNVEQVAVATGAVLATFPVGVGSRDIAISSNASFLTVLKCPGAACNVSEVDAFGHSVITVLPAPLNTVSVKISPDNALVWDLVGTQSYGNLQAFGLK